MAQRGGMALQTLTYGILVLPCLVGVALAAPPGSKSVIIQLFEWNWDSIASECTNFIGPAGYGYIQASPAQEHIAGTQWWTDYQPVSYTLTSKRGSRAQYANMIQTCTAAGVSVIADTVINHMTGQSSGTGVAGDSFTQFNYPAVPYSPGDFHYCGLEPNNNIVNWNNEAEVWTCQLEGLSDLATNSSNVQQKEAAYINDLLSLGVQGLRIDAAKNIPPSDLGSITSLLSRKPYITQEVIWGSGQPVTPALYTGIGDVMEFRYTYAVQNAFTNGSINSLQNLDNLGWVAGTGANVFVADHDTERGGGSLTYQSPSNTYTLAHVFSLAHPYGTPTVLSSYQFSSFDQGAPNNNIGTCSGSGGANGWLCQHRWPAVAGMVGFHNNVGSAPMGNWYSPQADQIAFGRGSLGFVAINNDNYPWTATFQTSLPAGTYCDVTRGIPSGSTCAGASYVVSSNGQFTATVLARDALALHTGALGTGAFVPVTFDETASTVYGENIFLSGSLPQLGSWNTANSVALSAANYPVWSVTMELPENTSFQYKFIRKESNGTIVWESDPNRSDTTPSSGSQTLTSAWR